MKKKLLALVINIVLMCLFVALVIEGVFYGIDVYTHHGKAIVVPDVKGKTVAEAHSTFKQYGLESAVVDSVYVKEELPGVIYDYTPAAGQRVKEGRNIYLTINRTNIPLITIPDVADNSSVREAHAKMRSIGLKLNKDEAVNGQKDWVYGVKYKDVEMANGAKVPVGATLTLMVGNGIEILKDSLETPNNEDDLNSWFQ